MRSTLGMVTGGVENIRLGDAHIEYAYGQLRDSLKPEAQPDERYRELKASLNWGAVDFCLEQLLTAELDWRTEGERGLGRASTYIPRLGAHFRKQIRDLHPADADQLYGILQDVALRGYLTMALLPDNPRPAVVFEPSEIYRRWLPLIYSQSSKLGDSLVDMLAVTGQTGFASADAFLTSHGMQSLTTAGSKSADIVWHYAFAGVILRAVEEGTWGSGHA
jgi:hypothetical protein